MSRHVSAPREDKPARRACRLLLPPESEMRLFCHGMHRYVLRDMANITTFQGMPWHAMGYPMTCREIPRHGALHAMACRGNDREGHDMSL